MKAVRHDPAQHFTCGRCTRCCRHFDVPVAADEAVALRKADLARLWTAHASLSSTTSEAAPGPVMDPLEAAPGGVLRLRRRLDGACGFLSEDGACRIHAGPGPQHKPLACRIFPFRLHLGEGTPLVTTSFSCPTVARNEGEPLARQVNALAGYAKAWRRAFPEEPRPLQFVASKPLAGAVAGEMRDVLQRLLARTEADGRRDLRANVARMADLLEDWTRSRVLGLAEPDFAEYVRLTGRFAADSEKPPKTTGATALARLQLRGFLLAVLAGRLQARGPRRGARLGLRGRLARIALHLHGLWPAVDGIDRGAVRRVALDLEAPGVADRVHHFLRSTLETLPTGERPLVDEMAFAFATLDAALRLAAMRAAAAGRSAVSEDDLVEALAEAADLGQSGSGGPLGAFLGSLTGGLQALRAFAGGP